jgi:hypothetical protein
MVVGPNRLNAKSPFFVASPSVLSFGSHGRQHLRTGGSASDPRHPLHIRDSALKRSHPYRASSLTFVHLENSDDLLGSTSSNSSPLSC